MFDEFCFFFHLVQEYKDRGVSLFFSNVKFEDISGESFYRRGVIFFKYFYFSENHTLKAFTLEVF